MLLLCLQYPLLLIFLGIAVLFLSTGFLLYTSSIAKRASFAFWCFFLSGAFLLAFIMAGFVFSIPTEELLFWVVLFLLGFQALFSLLRIPPVFQSRNQDQNQSKNTSISYRAYNKSSERRQS